MSGKRRLIWGVVLLLLVTGIWFSMNDPVEEQTLPPGPNAGQEGGPDKELKEVKLTLFDGEKTTRWDLTAEQITHYQDEGFLKMSPLQVKAFDLQGREELYTFTAERAQYHSSNGLLQIEGPIRIVEESFSLKADRLLWQSEEDLLEGQGGIGFYSSDYYLTGDRFLANPVLKKFRVYGNKEEQARFSWKGRNND